MKSDLDNQQSSVNDMLEQIKKIMSQEENSKENNAINENNILELSEEFIVENGNKPDKYSNKYYNHTNEIINNSHDLFDEIDRLIVDSDLSHDKSTSNHKEVSSYFNSNTVEKENKDSAIIDYNKLVINPEKPVLKTDINENIMEKFEINSDKKANLVSDSVVKESTQVLKELIDVIDKPTDNLKFRNGITVEELIIEAMKPQISEWLNANLSTIVKKVVEKEIRKLIPKEED